MRLKLGEREVELRVSERAQIQLAREPAPLDIEMELYFSCLLRKRVYFRATPCSAVAVRANLTAQVSVSFRPVMTPVCPVREVVGEPEVETLSLVRTTEFTPKWLTLDYARGAWSGEFGY